MSLSVRPGAATSSETYHWHPKDPGAPRRESGRSRSHRYSRRLGSFAAATLLAASMVPLTTVPADAALASVGAVDPANGFPTWYSDGTSKLKFCIDPAEGCLAAPPDAAAPISFPDNFPDEAFWFSARASGGVLRGYRAELEGAFSNSVVDGDQMGFARLRFDLTGLEPNVPYRIDHPYGVKTIVATTPDPNNPGKAVYRQTIDDGACAPSLAAPCDWKAVGDAYLGDFKVSTASFLKQVGAAPGTLGSITTAAPVTGAPSGTNAVIVTGPDAGGPGKNTLTINAFEVQGVLFNGADAAPSTPDLAAASDSGRTATDNITNDATPTFTGTVPGVSSPTTVEFLVDGVFDSALTTQTSPAGAYTVTTGALSSAGHRIQARIVDPASPAPPAAPVFLTSGTLNFVVDTVAPVTSMVAPFPSNPSADNTPTLNFTSNDAAAAYECQLLPSNTTWDPTCASPKTFDAQVNGSYTFNVRARDVAGNLGAAATFSWRIGTTTAPSAPTIGTATAGNASATVTWTQGPNGGSAITSQTVATVNSAGTVLKTQPAAATATSASVTGLTNGTGSYRFKVLATNALGSSPYSALSNAVTPVGPSDTTAPTVSARTPAVNARSVSQTVNVTATFSENVTGVSTAKFILRRAGTTTNISSTVTRNGTTNQWILNPAATLSADTRYTATLIGGTTGIRDRAGNPLATTSWTFLTGPRPTIISRSPVSGATAVSRTGNVTATFSEAMSGVTSSTFTLRNAAGTVSAVVSRSGTTNKWILNPGVTLAARTTYTARLSGGTTAVRDLAGNPLTTRSWSFTTGA